MSLRLTCRLQVNGIQLAQLSVLQNTRRLRMTMIQAQANSASEMALKGRLRETLKLSIIRRLLYEISS